MPEPTQEPTQEPTDDLSKPLGQAPKGKKKRLVIPIPLVTRAIAGVLALCVAVVAGWILCVDDPAGGEPMVIVSADTRTASQTAKPGEPASPAKPPGAPIALAEGEKPSGGQTVTIIDGSTGQRREVPVGPAGSGPAAKQNTKAEAKPDAPIDQRLLESSRHGVTPKIAPDGARPSEIYSRPVKPQAGRTEQPRVAIVIEGLGIGANSTAEALAKLPAPVTYAFAP